MRQKERSKRSGETPRGRSRLTTLLRRLGAALALLALVAAAFLSRPVESRVRAIEERPSTAYWRLGGEGYPRGESPLPGGHRVAYTRVAARTAAPGGERPPVVYLHGGPGGYVHSTTIAALGRLAEDGYDVYLYDQVGSGLSDRFPRPKDYGFEGHLADLLEIVDRHLEGGPVVLVGQSYGGILAGHFLARHPERVAAAVLTSPGSLHPVRFDDEGRALHLQRYPAPDHLEFVAPVESEGWGLGDWPPRAVAAVAIATTLDRKLMPDAEADGVLNDIASRITASMACDPARVPPEEGGGGFYSHGWSNWFGDVADPRPALATSPVPVLVLQGQCDYLPYATAYEYADLLPRGEYRFVEAAGHTLYWDRPAIFAEVVAPYLDRVLAGGG